MTDTQMFAVTCNGVSPQALQISTCISCAAMFLSCLSLASSMLFRAELPGSFTRTSATSVARLTVACETFTLLLMPVHC